MFQRIKSKFVKIYKVHIKLFNFFQNFFNSEWIFPSHIQGDPRP